MGKCLDSSSAFQPYGDPKDIVCGLMLPTGKPVDVV